MYERANLRTPVKIQIIPIIYIYYISIISLRRVRCVFNLFFQPQYKLLYREARTYEFHFG
jgi:hypothetical protein